MVEAIRRKSPRAPSISLNEALDRAIKAYDKERLHPAPVEIVANNIGYKNANNGAALSTIASMRYFGLLDRPKEGFLAVSKDVESFRFAPDEKHRQAMLAKFIVQPQLYNDLLEKYSSGLPSDASIKYELIQRGFIPTAAESVLSAFKQSVDFVGYFDSSISSDEDAAEIVGVIEEAAPLPPSRVDEQDTTPQATRTTTANITPECEQNDYDRIPVRLPGGRRAWLLIPPLFFAADKARLKAQIDLLLTEDEENA